MTGRSPVTSLRHDANLDAAAALIDGRLVGRFGGTPGAAVEPILEV
jgi:hypothetical protein